MAGAFRLLRRSKADSTVTGIAADLAGALINGELRLDYQPKLHLRQRRMVGMEALLRWQHPRHGLIPPDSFIPAAEQTDQIAALTLWVIAKAAADQQLMAAAGHDLPVFINVAAVLLANGKFVDQACGLICESGMRIGLEVTETSVIRDPDAAIANLKRVAAMGISIAIDDYGAGLSSLAYLKQLPACELKIDKLFITELTRSHRDPLIVRSTIDLAHAMEMQVVAEGVENAATFALLSVMGCDMAQGFFISRPLDIASGIAFLNTYREGWQETTAGGLPVRAGPRLHCA